MKKITGFIFALFVLLAGATLVPAMGLPSQGFSWELYANAYQTIRIFLPMIMK